MPQLRRLRELRGDERGFTLPEVLITTILMGIVFTIATSTWFGVIEGRSVDSATNELAADLRLAHTQATNRLAPQQVTLAAGSSEYTVTGSATPRDLDDDPASHELIVNSTMTITFNSDGSAALPGGATSATLTVSSADGDPDHGIEINSATSRIEIVP